MQHILLGFEPDLVIEFIFKQRLDEFFAIPQVFLEEFIIVWFQIGVVREGRQKGQNQFGNGAWIFCCFPGFPFFFIDFFRFLEAILGIPAPGAERLKQTSLLRAINNARQWMDKLINGEAANVTDLSKQLGLKTGYVTRILSLNSLAPDIVEAILAGIEPDGLSIAKLTEQPIPEDWNEQRRLYGFPTR
ncbi:MAG: hypothetical protein E7055_17970 [Lentisphaerae bacterium]|nr:hypothetical protein [Lentisphaerota bacterium]